MELEPVLILRAVTRQRRRLVARLRAGPPVPAEVRLAYDSLSRAERARIRGQIRVVQLLGAHFIPPWELPVFLAEALGGACGLFVRGDPASLVRESVSVVGARRCCAGAERWAADVARAAVREGFQVVSGGARGIDGAAHRGACEAGGYTVAFIGVGVDALYPAIHRRLFGRMIEGGGAVITEHPPGEGGRPFDHADRNRFIAAAGRSLWVAEAGARSGTLGTARSALAIGRPVYLSPPGVARVRGGLNALLLEGASEAPPSAFTVADAPRKV